MIQGFDADSLNKPGLNFPAARAQGYTHCYLKMGGNNLAGNAPYLMTSGPGYHGFMDEAISAGITAGSYWVTGGSDPVGAARFYLANLHPGTAFHVLDNESLDAGNQWDDAQACAFFDTLSAAGLTDLWMYGSRDALWNAQQWPGLQQRGIKALVAIYGPAPLTQCFPSTYPQALVLGHQYTSSAAIGNLNAMDADAFTDGAFDQGDDMPDMNTFLNTAAFDGGPSISTVLLNVNEVYNAIFQGGPSMPDGGQSLGKSLADINGIVSRQVTRDGQNLPQMEDNADTGTLVRQLVASVAALQAAVNAISGVTGADPAAIQSAAQAGAQAALDKMTLATVKGN